MACCLLVANAATAIIYSGRTMLWQTERLMFPLCCCCCCWHFIRALNWCLALHSHLKLDLRLPCLGFAFHVTPHCRCLIHDINAINLCIGVKWNILHTVQPSIKHYFCLIILIKVPQVCFFRDVAFYRIRSPVKAAIPTTTAPDNQLINQINQIRCRNSSER